MVLTANRKGHVIIYQIILTFGSMTDRTDESPALPPCYKHIEILDKIQQNSEGVLKACSSSSSKETEIKGTQSQKTLKPHTVIPRDLGPK